MNGEKNTKYDDKLVFKNSGKIFTLRSHVRKMIKDFKINTTDSLDAKLIIDFMDGIRFDKPSRGKDLTDRKLIKNFLKKRAILSSVLKRSEATVLFSHHLND